MATEFTLEELSKLTGEPIERLGAWQARGLIGEGDGDQFDQRDAARAEMIRDLLRLGIEMDAIAEVFGQPDSEAVRHFLEHCEVDAGKPAYSVGQAAELTGLEIEQLRRLMEAMGIRGELHHLDARNEVMHAFADHAKARRVFDIRADTLLLDGLSKMATWARKAGIRKSARFENLELTENLPPIWTEN